MRLINGSLKKKLEIDDGYIHSKSVFETLLVVQGKGIFLKEHVRRLKEGIDFLSITQEIIEDEVVERIRYFSRILKIDRFVLKIQVSDRNIVYSTREYIYNDEDYVNANLGISDIRKGYNPLYCYKTTNILENSLELKKGKENGYIDVLLLNMKEEVLEGCISNVFLIHQNDILTPSLKLGILDGIVRRWVITNFNVKEEILTKKLLEKADGIFITNSLMGIMPIKLLVDKKIDSYQNKVIKSVFQQYTEIIQG